MCQARYWRDLESQTALLGANFEPAKEALLNEVSVQRESGVDDSFRKHCDWRSQNNHATLEYSWTRDRQRSDGISARAQDRIFDL